MKTLNSLSLFIIISIIAISCGQKPQGETAETGEAQAVAESTSAAESFDVLPNESIVTWVGYKPTGKHNGTINITGGSLSVEGGAVTSGNFTFDIKSLKVLDIPEEEESHAKLTGHLMSDDFFDAENHPTATFELVSVEDFTADKVVGDKEQYETEYTPAANSELMVENPTHVITGNLTMRGVTKSITFPANVDFTDNGVMAKASFNIDRTEWNLAYGDEANAVDKAKDKFIYNTVSVGFQLEASKAMNASM